MYGQKFGRKLVMPLRIERNRNGQKKNEARQCSKTDFIDPDYKEYSEFLFKKYKEEHGKTYGSRDAA